MSQQPAEPSRQDLDGLKKLGWRKDGANFVGAYKTEFGSWDGIIRPKHGKWKFYILGCPEQVLNGSHQACIHRRSKFEGRTQHWIHFHTANTDPISGIIAIVQLIQEDFS